MKIKIDSRDITQLGELHRKAKVRDHLITNLKPYYPNIEELTVTCESSYNYVSRCYVYNDKRLQRYEKIDTTLEAWSILISNYLEGIRKSERERLEYYKLDPATDIRNLYPIVKPSHSYSKMWELLNLEIVRQRIPCTGGVVIDMKEGSFSWATEIYLEIEEDTYEKLLKSDIMVYSLDNHKKIDGVPAKLATDYAGWRDNKYISKMTIGGNTNTRPLKGIRWDRGNRQPVREWAPPVEVPERPFVDIPIGEPLNDLNAMRLERHPDQNNLIILDDVIDDMPLGIAAQRLVAFDVARAEQNAILDNLIDELENEVDGGDVDPVELHPDLVGF